MEIHIHMKMNIEQQHFHFQVRESPSPLNIPTATLAPDRGPVACLSGPVASAHKTCHFDKEKLRPS